ncbi:undecaprenyl-phosphate galactose phosphotransferase WbaP [Niveibacterium terrae]|uniref:undecaprenyl-phosphate galactose phosphotransferase WbaP n=1 Tax=Niveibacterium terrae TaxID=3373598 RepID=UPI003A903D38
MDTDELGVTPSLNLGLPATVPQSGMDRFTVAKWCLVLADVLVVVLAALIDTSALGISSLESLHLAGFRHLGENSSMLLWGCAGVIWLWVNKGNYSSRKTESQALAEALSVFSIAFLGDGASCFLFGAGESRIGFIASWVIFAVVLVLSRYLMRRILDRFGIWRIPVVIVGCGENAVDAANALLSENGLGYDIVGFFAPAAAQGGRQMICVGDKAWKVENLELGLERHLHDHGQATTVVLALEQDQGTLQQTLVEKLSIHHPHLKIAPPFRGLPLYGTETMHFFSHEVLFITVRNNLARLAPRCFKRAFDILVSIALLLMLSPLFLVVGALIMKTGARPFYGHTRVGRNGRLFKCLKFQSMVPNAGEVLKELLANDPAAREEWARDFKLKNDPRVTKIGDFLRRTSLDELPQLINVIKGEMSLVGPRPVVEAELERYGEYRENYLGACPGITGLWQISGRNDIDYARRVSFDTWYVRNWSVWYDLVILWRTVSVVFKRQGAY